MIHATCHTDDLVYDVAFDAAPWFRQATDAQILALAAIDWGGEEAAEAVAAFARDCDPNLAALFAYLDRQPRPAGRGTVGFECYVDGDEALAWLREHRPGVHARIGTQWLYWGGEQATDGGPADPQPLRDRPFA